MTFAISEFKSNLKGGGARSSLFDVTITFPSNEETASGNVVTLSTTTNATSQIKFLVSATSIPASTLATYDIFYHGKALKVAADRTFDAWDTTIINDENFLIRNDIERWIDTISKPDLNTRSKNTTDGIKEGTQAKYKSTGVVTQYGKDSTAIRKYKFNGLFPTALSSIDLNWEAGVIETYTCSWVYDSWELG